MSKPVILVTGASSGFGLMTAKSLAQAGHTVYASMRETEGRNAPQVAAVAAWASRTEGRSAHRRAGRAVRRFGRGRHRRTSSPTPAVSTSSSTTPATWCSARPKPSRPEQFIQQYDVNVLGAQRVNRAALPHLRGQHKGLLGLGRLLLDARRHSAFPRALFRGQGGDGRAGGVLLDRACPLGYRDDDHGARRLHQGHQPLRSLGQAVPMQARVAEYEAGPYAGIADKALKGLAGSRARRRRSGGSRPPDRPGRRHAVWQASVPGPCRSVSGRRGDRQRRRRSHAPRDVPQYRSGKSVAPCGGRLSSPATRDRSTTDRTSTLEPWVFRTASRREDKHLDRSQDDLILNLGAG